MLEIQLARIEWTSDGEQETTTAISPPLKILDYVPKAPSNGEMRVSERIRLSVARDAPTWLRILNGAGARAREWAQEQRFRRDLRNVIRVRDNNRHAVWFEAPLYDARVTLRNSGGRVLDFGIERGAYWEGAEATLQVMNSGTELAWEDTATVYNHDDDMPGHNNWVLVRPPAGDVATPVRMRIRNTYNVSARLRRVYAGWYNRPQQLMLDVKDATGATLYPDNTEYSYDKRGGGSSFRWEVPNTSFADFTGMFKVLANGTLGGGNWQLGVGYELTQLQTGREVPGSRGWTDLGNVMLPPGRYAHPTRYPMGVWLEGDAEGVLDFLVFIPVSTDSQLRELVFQGYNAVPGACIEDDGIYGELVYQFGEQRMPILYSYGQPVMAQPEHMLPQALPVDSTVPNAQMISFALENDGGGAEAMRTAEIALSARPWYEILP